MTNEVTHTICPECSLCFTPDSYDILIKRLVVDNDRLRAALMSIGIAEGCENYPEELRAAILMDKARIALIGE
jgi:hypothetical protein